jgi:hypothetical protein
LKRQFFGGMNDELFTMLSMAVRGLPARVHAKKAAELLGFTFDDMAILMGDPKLDLKPLGSPVQNAPKFFATAQVLKLASDVEWLHRASNAIRRHHLKKREHRSGTGQRRNNLQRDFQQNFQQTTLDRH